MCFCRQLDAAAERGSRPRRVALVHRAAGDGGLELGALLPGEHGVEQQHTLGRRPRVPAPALVCCQLLSNSRSSLPPDVFVFGALVPLRLPFAGSGLGSGSGSGVRSDSDLTSGSDRISGLASSPSSSS